MHHCKEAYGQSNPNLALTIDHAAWYYMKMHGLFRDHAHISHFGAGVYYIIFIMQTNSFVQRN